ncbi:coenzyme Q-binding protein COQ10 [Erythrobacter litoralis]|jgi:coenzyme Q-binding protein COQ10|uniref:Cyclase n=1 Tax=Erythrobacter litoralis TaxID=39960 RepID=A0A074N029_9SPHN|nr:type II toxin-antitoxin system RatA family toxin [Erythrobacter litoralis]AOL23506.1 coenzyme Q-binding protein COQ10 [Erythrobacter litoralis]KEO99009.1 cyclase [Erythrobacter litoralis]MEE4339773.1 type II toxin-antitoxin system RatA family toxin [Erythrobacter sp.]
MPGIRETRRLPYSCEQMFDLVADVKRYGEFLPWVIATRVRSDSETEMIADMVVGFKAIRESFTSRVLKRRPREIEVIYLDGPLSDLDNVWTFREIDEHSCEIDFAVDFTFKNKLFERIAGQYFDRAFRKMVAAFEARANELYGNSNSSAHSVA